MRPWRVLQALRSTTQLAVISAARSHVGLVRQINEDRIFESVEARLWAVADGMGGHGGGDVAAQTIVDTLREAANGVLPIDAATMLDALRTANRTIAQRNESRSEDAGATMVALHLDDSLATVAWAGDSRAYLLRDGMIQLTHDHSVVQELVDAGLLAPEAALRHPRANVVTRALGAARDVDIAVTRIEVRCGDRILLCSDGLSRSLNEPILNVSPTLQSFADALLRDALQRDGHDNISLIVVDVSEPGEGRRLAS